jgi:hypothetical protein
MPPLRTDIETALDELISSEEWMTFQTLAVVLAKQKWPDLIASERKKDLGLDAHAPVLLAEDGKERGLACSLTAAIEKIRSDVETFQQESPSPTILVFSTPRKVTESTKTKWAATIRKKYSIELIVVSREDIITDLMLPSNASICRSLLRISLPVEPTLAELIEKTRAAASDVAASWLAHPRLVGKPKIGLQGIKLDNDGKETGDIVDLASLETALLQSRRIVVEAPAGAGKTTTLIQLASRRNVHAELAFLVDLPAWMTSGVNFLEIIARMPPYMSRSVRASDLANLCGSVHCSFLLNGWNEISENYSEEALRALAQVERDFPTAGIIVTSRTHHIRPPLPGALRVRLLSLSRAQRAEYLRQALTERAGELHAELELDPALDELTRTELFLAEVTTLFRSGSPIPKTKMGVLGAAVQLVERSDEHAAHLDRAPPTGNSGEYLAELAASVTATGEVTLADAKARPVVHFVSERLKRDGQIATSPEPAAILSTLCAHHVLERVDYPAVGFRFQHQQFQEFYAAVILKHELSALADKTDPEANRAFARNYVNKPAWEEPLRMLAEDLGHATVG